MGTLDALRMWSDRNARDLDMSDVEADGRRAADHMMAETEQLPNVGARLMRSQASARPNRTEPLFIQVRPKGDRYVYVLLDKLTGLNAEAGRAGREWYERNRETLSVDNGSEWINRLKSKIAEGALAAPIENVRAALKPNVWAEWRAVAAELCALGGRHGARFAVDTEDDAINRIAFWWIVPNEGPQGTRYFIRQVIGGQGPVRVRMSPEAMLAIGRKIQAAGAEDAMRRYGREIGECGHCGRTLTNDASRAAGIGPVCAAKHG